MTATMTVTPPVIDRPPPVTEGAPALHLPDGSLVVVAGLPGAGKTTLLRRLAGTPGASALDSEDVARVLRGVPLPYRLLRPLVHALHLARLAVLVHGRAAVVITTDPCTSPRRRWLLRSVSRLSGRSLHVVLVDASCAQARDGRRRRGRDLPAARTARHERRYAQLADHVDRRLSRAQAARATASVSPRTRPAIAAADASPTKEHPSMSTRRARRRPGLGIPAVATLLGLWFGVTAPEVSPVLEPPGGTAAAGRGIADQADGDPAGDVPGADAGEPGGPR
jgi:energy-coupling factor transporter ATP-binding protein EcfA2